MSESVQANSAGPPAGARLNSLLGAAGLTPLDKATTARFEAYLALLLRWNAKMNLTAIRDEEGILARHFVESIACARALPRGITTLLDFGSGAGLPGIPIALCRPEIAVTLAESQTKKAAFLREAVRTLGLGVRVHAGRGEELTEPFDCVALRAVDRMAEAVHAAPELVGDGGWLAVLTTDAEFEAVKSAAGAAFAWSQTQKLPGGEARILALGRKPKSE